MMNRELLDIVADEGIFENASSGNTLIIVGAVLAVVVIAAVIIIVRKSRNKNVLK